MTMNTPENNSDTTSQIVDEDNAEPQSSNLPVVYQPPEIQKAPNFFQRLAYAFRPGSNTSVRQNLQAALESETYFDQTIAPAERAMLGNILRLREVRVVDVMLARAEIQAVEISTMLGDLLVMFETSGHSRLPVYGETLDDPRGMIHIRDIVGYIIGASRKKRRSRKAALAGEEQPVAKTRIAGLDLSAVDLSKTIAELKLARPVLFVPPSMLASDLMARMQASRTQMALVIDEYGGTDGLVSLEDIVEMVVGDIEDEHDDEEVRVESRADGSFMVDARVELEDVAEYLGPEFLVAAHKVEDEVDTIGGLVFSLLGHIPVRGEVVHGLEGYEIEVCDADPRRIRSAIVRPVKQAVRRRTASK